jgi:transcriptional regulator
MYVPAAFKEDRPDELLEIMRQCTLPVLISPVREAGELRLVATHLPLLISNEKLAGHIARANTQWKQLDPAMESLAIFKAVDGYVSPSHYATKIETGKVVPTWNYEAVHAYGRLEIVEDSAGILEMAGERCAGGLYRRAVTRHRRCGAAHHPVGGCAQAEPE